MKRLALILSLFAVSAWADPFAGGERGNSFYIHVEDVDIDNAYELVTDYDSFTQTSVDSTVKVFYDTLAAGGAGDTLNVRIRGVRPGAGPDSLESVVFNVKVGGGDTVATDSTIHIFEAAWLDTTGPGIALLFSRYSTPRGSLLDTIAAGRLAHPVAHVFFGNDDRPILDAWRTSLTSEDGDITFELRFYQQINQNFVYTTDYEVIDKVTLSSATGNTWYVNDFGGYGKVLPKNSALAVFALGSTTNTDGTATLIGRRRR